MIIFFEVHLAFSTDYVTTQGVTKGCQIDLGKLKKERKNKFVQKGHRTRGNQVD